MRLFRRRHAREFPLCIFCYHKVGTVLFTGVFSHLCRERGWNFQALKGHQTALPPDADVVLFGHSLIDLDAIRTPFRGVHLIRDPRDVIVSGYLYHRRTTEKWCVNCDFDPTPPILHPRVPHSQQHRPDSWKIEYLESLGGRSYQENLLRLPQSEGLLFEMNHYGAWTIESMRAWDYQRENILEVRFEEVMAGFDDTFRRIFRHFDFSASEIDRALAIAAEYDLGRKTDRQIGRMKHVSSTRSRKWRDYFEERHKTAFLEKFDDVLVRLGYEDGPGW